MASKTHGTCLTIQNSFLLIYFRSGPKTCSHYTIPGEQALVRVREKFWPRRTRTSEPARRIKYTKVWHRNYPIFDVPLLRSSRRSLIRYINCTEITVLIKCVNRSIVLYDFRDGAKVIQYSLNIALIHE